MKFYISIIMQRDSEIESKELLGPSYLHYCLVVSRLIQF
jgi:hypothetical protein